MLIGAHVSPAGGPAKAVERGLERGATAIQIFNQNPRAWKPTIYSDDQVAAYHEAMDGSEVKALLIHAVYLLNAASEDPDIRAKTLVSLTESLRAGDRLGAHAVVLHPGSAKTGEVAPAIARAGEVIAEGPDIEIFGAAEGVALEVVNTGDRDIQVRSHTHFFEANRALRFERARAWGMKLDVIAGAGVRFEPGIPKIVHLVPIDGARVVHGQGGLVNGPLDAPGARETALETARSKGYQGA